MSLEQVEINRTYRMKDNRILRIIREWTAEDGHSRVAFDVIDGPKTGHMDCSKRDFLAMEPREVIRNGE